MTPTAELSRKRIVVADEDHRLADLVLGTLRAEGYTVFHALDALAAAEIALALERCDLLMSDTRVAGIAAVDLIYRVRERLPGLPVIYLANRGRSTPDLEGQLPADAVILREPFSALDLRRVVQSLVPPQGRQRIGS